MRTLPALFLALSACSSDAEPEILSLSVDPSQGAPGDTIEVMADVANMTFSGAMGAAHGDDHGNGGDDHGDEHGDDHDAKEKDKDGFVGHIHLYFDSFDINPVLQMLESPGEFIVPDDLEPGMHTLFGRIHGSDHTIYEPQIFVEIDFEVLASE